MANNYVPSPKHFKNYFLYQKFPNVYKPLDKVPVNKIKVDKERLAIANEVDKTEVDEIVNNFHLEGWEPIFIDPDYYLRDGQHRLMAAKKMNVKFIDVIMINEKLMD